MSARGLESALLTRCSSVARAPAKLARDRCEASVFRVASMLVRSRFSSKSNRLMVASDRYFAAHPDDLLAPTEVVRQGWVLSLSRLRDMLSQQLQVH